MAFAGTWNLDIKTPIGIQRVILAIHDHDGELTGHATGRDSKESVPLRELASEGDRLTWQQSITRPLRLNLAFDVTISGETIVGTSKAGRLPSSKVIGQRVRSQC